jgi:hypothetical protein
LPFIIIPFNLAALIGIIFASLYESVKGDSPTKENGFSYHHSLQTTFTIDVDILSTQGNHDPIIKAFWIRLVEKMRVAARTLLFTLPRRR